MRERLRLDAGQGLLFVCSGNMVRSAFAELYARHLGLAAPVRSAATTYANPSLHPRTRAALLARGVAPEQFAGFRPTRLAALDPPPGAGELVLGMTREHLADARAQGAPGPGLLLTEAAGLAGEIGDPYFDGGWDEVFATLARCVEALQRALAE
ncbi:MAG: hypothetical protein H6828_02675 [Planctomycetes bacterium]|nr:hypothetical protein [Planctomycetota bacterium]